MGVGGMIGGGIFSVLGLAVGITGHAAPLAFSVGALIALAAGYSYVRLALTIRDDGASFTYLIHAFPQQPNIASIAGWTAIMGYVGTLALYAFTFGAYGAVLLGQAEEPALRITLSTAVLIFFLLVNLKSAMTSGRTEDLIVYAKILLLGVFAVAGLSTISTDRLSPVFDQGVPSVFMAGALIFVAYEGFQLITNAVHETHHPDRNIPLGIYGSIIITSMIYITLAFVAIGNLSIADIMLAEEYALAAAAKPVLGASGTTLVGVAALLATSSAINATVFGAARMIAEMASQHRMPHVLARRNLAGVPWAANVALIVLALIFTLVGGLEVIAAFSSLTFLLVSIGVSIANLRLRVKTQCKVWLVVLGLSLMSVTVILLITYLWRDRPDTLISIMGIYGAVILAEFSDNLKRKKSITKR